MSRLNPPIVAQAIAIPALAAGIILVLMTMEGQNQAAQYAVVLPISYLLGSISWGYILLSLRMGVDVREYGSGRTGMTNVLRTGGGKAAGLVLALDVSKGVLAVILAREIIGTTSAEVVASLVVLVGHNWPVFLGFRGGRGILTALGALVMMTPVVAGIGALTFLTAALSSRYISLGSILGVIISGLSIVGLALAGLYSETYMLYALIGGAMLIWQHRDNIQRLRDGNELRLGHAATKVE